MKVCLLNESFPPVLDGVANVLINYANYLQDDYNAQIVVGTPRYPGAIYSQYRYPVVAYSSFDTAAHFCVNRRVKYGRKTRQRIVLFYDSYEVPRYTDNQGTGGKSGSSRS